MHTYCHAAWEVPHIRLGSLLFRLHSVAQVSRLSGWKVFELTTRGRVEWTVRTLNVITATALLTRTTDCCCISNCCLHNVLYLQESVWPGLPLLVCGSMSLLAALVTCLVPETKDQPMPQTVSSGERFIKTHRVLNKLWMWVKVHSFCFYLLPCSSLCFHCVLLCSHHVLVVALIVS